MLRAVGFCPGPSECQIPAGPRSYAQSHQTIHSGFEWTLYFIESLVSNCVHIHAVLNFTE